MNVYEAYLLLYNKILLHCEIKGYKTKLTYVINTMQSFSKDIWSLIIKHLPLSSFLNTILVEKNSYEGFKMILLSRELSKLCLVCGTNPHIHIHTGDDECSEVEECIASND